VSTQVLDIRAGLRLRLPLLEMMYTLRSFEENAKSLYKQGLLTGALHTYIGEEAVAVGVCSGLREDDYITSTHRGHGHCIAKGGDLGKTLAELLGRETGYSRGRGGSMHLFAPEIGLLGGNGIVGAGIPIAVGAAYSAKYRGTDQVVACFFGDGASNQGTFHEGANMASLWKLPVVFVCENNHWAATTPVSDSTSVPDIAIRAAGYDMPGEVVDGNDVLAVHEGACRAVARARAQEGPSLIECKTFRHDGHCMVVHDYRLRTPEEDQSWRCKDPIDCLERKLLQEKLSTREKLDGIKQRVRDKLAEAERFARESSFPDPEIFQSEHERGNWACVR
jgi:TPP-dependent pyruvate/acetoin dehydrogenase alpha subunit